MDFISSVLNCFYATLAGENGYVVERMLFVHRNQAWYSVRKPAEIRQRVELFTHDPTLLYIYCPSRGNGNKFSANGRNSLITWPPQDNENQTAVKHLINRSNILFSNQVPFARHLQTAWRTYKGQRQCLPSNRTSFVPVNLD